MGTGTGVRSTALDEGRPTRTLQAARGRVTLFRVVAALVVGGLLAGPGGVADLLAPATIAHLDHPGAQLHRWHSIDLAALVSLLVAGMLLVAILRPRAVAVVQTLVVSLLLLAAVSTTTPDPAEVVVPATVVVLLVITAYPWRRELVRVPATRWRHPIAVLAAAVPTPFLLLDAGENLGRQIGGTDPHALLGHWAGASALAVALLVAGWVSATEQAGSRGLALVVAVAHLYLGVSAVLHPSYDGAWGPFGTVSALLAAVLLVWSLWRAPSREVTR